MKIRIPYLERRVRRDKRGRVVWSSWYWVPSKRLRAMDWKVMALGSDPDHAKQMAIRQNKDVERNKPPMTGTIADAIRAYRADDEYPKAEATIRSYEQNLLYIEKWAGDKPLSAITPKVIKELKNSLKATPYKANAIIGMIRILYGFARRDGLHEGSNPASAFRRVTVQPRHQVWEPEQEAALAKAALEADKPSLWIAMALSLYAGQRQTDCLAMQWQQYDGHRLCVRQSKTAALVEIPVLGPLKRLLDVARADEGFIVVNEATGDRYSPDTFRHACSDLIRTIGAKGELQYRDARRTAVVRMFHAGLSIEEISGYTGHTIDHTKAIIETYLPRSKRITAESEQKLLRYYEQLGKRVQ